MTTDALERYITRFITRWRKTLGLSGWTIFWMWETKAEVDKRAGYPAVAVTSYDASQQVAHTRLDQEEEWQTKDRDHHGYLPSVLIHELTHIRMSAAEDRLDLMANMVKSYLPEQAGRDLRERIVGIREMYTEAVTHILQDLEDECKSKK